MMSTMNSNSFSPVAPPAVRSHTIQLEPNTTPNGGISRSISEEFNQYTDYKSYERRSSLRNNDSLGLSFNEAEELSPPEGLMWQADTSDSSLQWAQQEPVPDLSRPTTPRRTIFPDYSPQSFPAGQANRSGTPSSVRPPPTTTVPPMVFACPIPQSPLRRNTLQFPVYEHELPTTFSPMMSSPALSPMGSPMMVDTPGASPTHSPSRSQSPYFYSLHSPARTPGPFAGGSPSPVLLYSSLAPEVFPRNHVRAYVTQAYPAEFESPKATDAEEQPRVVSPSPEKKPRKKKEPKGKAKSALNPPKAPPSMWQLFFKEYLEKVKEEDIIGKKVNLIDITKAAAALYKSLPATEVEILSQRIKKLKDQYRREYTAWEKTLTPGDIRLENAYRKAQRKAGESRVKNMRDPNAPVKPASPYFCFLKHVRGDKDLNEEVYQGATEARQQTVLAAAKWKSLSDDEKKVYFDEAEVLRQEYNAKLMEYEKGR